MGRHSPPTPREDDEPRLEIPDWQVPIWLGLISLFAILGVWCIVVEFIT